MFLFLWSEVYTRRVEWSRASSGPLRIDRQRDQRRRRTERRAGDAVVAAPGPVLALDGRQPRADALAEVGPLRAAERGLGLRRQHVRDVLLSAVAPESAQHVLVGELRGAGLARFLGALLQLRARRRV